MLAAALPASAQTMDPYYAADYTLLDLGSVAGVPPLYGGLTFRTDDANVLLLGGQATSTAAKLYAIQVARFDNGHVTSFGCATPTVHADANSATSGIDGGLCFGPGGVIFFTTWPDNTIGQIKPGSVAPDKLIAAASLGVTSSTGSLMFVPPGFAGAGRLKIVSFAGTWHDTTVSPDGLGTYDIAVAAPSIPIGGGPEGVVYVAAGNPKFTVDSILVSEYGTGSVVSYEIDGNGDPIVATRRVFLSGFGNVEGAAIDPATGDFFFSTWGGGNRILRVRGFTTTPPCRADLNLDGVVNQADLAYLLSCYLIDPCADIDGNCATDQADLAFLLAEYNVVCP